MFKKLMAGKSVTLCCVPSVLCFALFPLICSVLCVFPLVCVLFLLCCAPSDGTYLAPHLPYLSTIQEVKVADGEEISFFLLFDPPCIDAD